MNSVEKNSSGIIRRITGMGGLFLTASFLIALIHSISKIPTSNDWIYSTIAWSIASLLSIIVMILGITKKVNYRTISKYGFGFASVVGIFWIICVYTVDSFKAVFISTLPFRMLATLGCLITFILLLLPNKNNDQYLDLCIGVTIPISLLFVIINECYKASEPTASRYPLAIIAFVLVIIGLVTLLLSSIWGLIKNYKQNKESA